MDVCEQAVKEMGLTKDIKEAGWIYPDGRMLDLSGKRQTSTGYEEVGDYTYPKEGMRDYLKSKRAIDHREVPLPITEFMERCDAIRFSHQDGVSVDMIKKPTVEQSKIISQAADGAKYLVAEKRNKDKNKICGVETHNPTRFSFQKFVDKCWREDVKVNPQRYTMDAVIQLSNDKGSHFFDYNTMKFFKSKVHTDELIGNKYFIMSNEFSSGKRRFEVYEFDGGDNEIFKIHKSDYKRIEFDTLKEAKEFAACMGKYDDADYCFETVS